MLKPSYSELMNTLNTGIERDNRITSRYTIVIAAAKRARQVIDGAHLYTTVSPDKAVSVAVDEMNRGFIKTYPDDESIPEKYRPALPTTADTTAERDRDEDDLDGDTFNLEAALAAELPEEPEDGFNDYDPSGSSLFDALLKAGVSEDFDMDENFAADETPLGTPSTDTDDLFEA